MRILLLAFEDEDNYNWNNKRNDPVLIITVKLWYSFVNLNRSH